MQSTGIRFLTTGPPSRLRCSVPSGTGANKILIIETSNGLSSQINFNYDQPTVQHCTRCPTEGGDVIITGCNFGPTARDVEVSVGAGSINSGNGNGTGSERRRGSVRTIRRLSSGERDRIVLESVRLLRPHCAIRCHISPGVGKDLGPDC